MDTKISLDSLEKERDFYFGKLRDIELYCQQQEDVQSNRVLQKILEILYETEVSFSSLLHIRHMFLNL